MSYVGTFQPTIGEWKYKLCRWFTSHRPVWCVGYPAKELVGRAHTDLHYTCWCEASLSNTYGGVPK